MGMSHADCNHPRTPAGRRACRDNRRAELFHEDAIRIRVLDAGQPVVARNTPRRVRKAPSVQLKRPGTRLRTIGDLPDVPRMLAHGCRIAWDLGWDVVVGPQFNDDEKRILTNGPVAELALVWKPSTPDGVWGVFVRKHGHPITHRVESIDHAFRLASGDDDWTWG